MLERKLAPRRAFLPPGLSVHAPAQPCQALPAETLPQLVRITQVKPQQLAQHVDPLAPEPDLPEASILLRALRDFNTPKIPLVDTPIFLRLISDLFMGLEVPLKIDEIIHKVKVEVDEAGTVAAAATAVVACFGAAPRAEPPPFQMRCDRPFAFSIVALQPTPLVLFAGTVVEPGLVGLAPAGGLHPARTLRDL